MRRSGQLPASGKAARWWFAREPPHNTNQLGVCDVGRIAEFVDRVGIGQSAQAEKFANALPSVELQLGGAVSEQKSVATRRRRTDN